MKNKSVIETLDKIKAMIKKEQYEDTLNYIESSKLRILFEEDKEQDYIDEVVNSLK